MSFENFSKAVRDNFAKMSKESTRLFTVDVDKDELWELYLSSFPKGTNPVYRVNTEHDCSCCRHFIKSVGNVVAIKSGKVYSIWDVDINDKAYKAVANALSTYIKRHAVNNVFLTKETRLGTKLSREIVDNKVITYNHFYVDPLSRDIVPRSASVDTELSQYRDTKNVFKRSLEEINIDSVETVLELIKSNTLYKGNEWLKVLTQFATYKKKYDGLADDKQRDLYAWEHSIEAGMVIGRIRNHSIGVLLTNISNGMDLDNAVTQYEKIVAPSNYKRPKAIFTQKMLDEAKQTITELGYLDSLQRRYATLDDITVNNILFSNKDSSKRITGAEDIFSEMSKEVVSSKPKKFDRIEEVSVDNFLKNIVPNAHEIELYFENRLTSNMVSLIAPAIRDSKSMFKWANNFSWSYTGNMTDSMMKERVKSAGGKVDGVLRFSIQWNDIDTGKDDNDLDAHCITPKGTEIYYSHKRDSITGGELDIDVIHPQNEVAVENITWADKSKMTEGIYRFFVHQFTNRGGRDGFRAEIEFDGQIYSFDYRNELRQNEKVMVAEVTYKNGQFTIKELLPSAYSSREVWGLTTNNFIPVSVICFSPNYWDEQQGIGNKHIMFMLKECINPESPNGFFNEFLKEGLVKHKRVFEALGSKMKVADSDDQLSGVGFCLTKRNYVVVKVKGNIERIIKVMI